jgi:DNA transformation protein and related proteins
MPVSEEFLNYLRELLEWVPELRAKRMFGGYGLYSGDAFFAILVDNALYLKGDDQAREIYRAGGGTVFGYLRQGKPQTMDYWSVPAEVLEEPETLRAWVRGAIDAALRANARKS